MSRCEDEKMRYRPPLLEEPCAQTLSGKMCNDAPGIGLICFHFFGRMIRMANCQVPGYKGQHWPTTVVYGVQEMHIFAIGDWGGMDGSLDTNEGRPNIVAYNWGKRPGPSVFPRSRWNKAHTVQFCDHKQLVECFNTRGQPPCIPGVRLCARPLNRKLICG